MTGQTIKRQPVDLGARLRLFFFPYTVTLSRISHSAGAAEKAEEVEEDTVEPECRHSR